jgi:hypothetical protein
MLVWRIKPNGGTEENPVNEVDFSTEDKALADQAVKFEMKGGICLNPEGQDSE